MNSGPPKLTNAARTYPLPSLLGVLVGGVLALLIFPDDPHPAGALWASAAALAVGLMVGPVVASIRDPKAFFRVEHLLMVGLTYWLLLDLLQGTYALIDVSSAGIYWAFAMIVVFAGCIWVACLFPPHRVPTIIVDAAQLSLTNRQTFWLATLCFLLAMLNYLIASGFDLVRMVSGLGEGRFDAPWVRGAEGGWEAFRDHLQYFGFLLPTLTAILAIQRGWLHLSTILTTLMTGVILLFLAQGGGRRNVGVAVAAAIMCWILNQPRFGTRHVFLATVAVSGLLLFMELMLEYRTTGFSRMVEEGRIELENKHLRVDDNFLRLAQIIDLFPNSFSYLYGERVFFTLVRPVPRVLWPGKPVSRGFDLAATLGFRGTTFSASVIADLYMSWGLFAVIIGGLCYGRIAGMWSELLAATGGVVQIFVYSLGAMAIFASLRSLDELVLQSYSLLGWLVLSRLMLRRAASVERRAAAAM